VDASALIAGAGLEPTARAEDIAVGGYVALAQALAARRGLGHDVNMRRTDFESSTP